jgi:glycosyltransferase involved in cell wall biosynthesis
MVVAELIRTCNEHDAVPVLFSFTPEGADARFKKEYGEELRYSLHSVNGVRLSRGTAYQTPLLNILTRPNLTGFNVVLNSGRCPYFLPKGPKYFHYVHFPLEASLNEEEHFQSLIGALYTLPLKALYFRRAGRIQDGVFVANSHFTLSKTEKLYSAVPKSHFHVVYPPCNIIRGKGGQQRDIDVVTLGSFISDKRQLEQLKIARQLSFRRFVLIGGIKSKRYLKKCRKFVERNGITNVRMLLDASKEEVQDALERAKAFLHTKRGEHFGISTVEAIGRGCIPIVHDSGGLRETVPDRNLRFDSLHDACSKIENVLTDYRRKQRALLPPLLDNIHKFDRARFRDKMARMIFAER